MPKAHRGHIHTAHREVRAAAARAGPRAEPEGEAARAEARKGHGIGKDQKTRGGAVRLYLSTWMHL